MSVAVRAMEKVLVAGTGLTGAVLSSMLRREGLPASCQLSVWDKAKAAGGRMSTSRNPSNSSSTIDIGAQYISSEPEHYDSNARFYSELISQNILSPLKGNVEGDKEWRDGTQHFISPDGMRSVVTHFLKEPGLDIKYGHRITKIDEVKGRWLVSAENGAKEDFDALVLTMPVPQILALDGDIRSVIASQPGISQRLGAVQYSSRFVLGLFYDQNLNVELPWCAKYFRGDPVIVFISLDNVKRGKASSDVGTSILVHTSVPFSLKHLEEDAESVCNQHVLPRLQELLPQLPQPSHIKCHKWRYSQVFQGYDGSPGAVTLRDKPLLVCAGDAFTKSGFDFCVDSAREAYRTITNCTYGENIPKI